MGHKNSELCFVIGGFGELVMEENDCGGQFLSTIGQQLLHKILTIDHLRR